MFQPKEKLQQAIGKVFYTLNAWLSLSLQIVWLRIGCTENTHSLWCSGLKASHKIIVFTQEGHDFSVKGVHSIQLLISLFPL